MRLVKFSRCCIVILLMTAAARVNGQYFTSGASYLTMGNDSVELKFQKWDGELYSFYDKIKSIEYVKEKNTNWSLFNMKLNINGSSAVIGGWVGNNFSFDTLRRPNSLVLNLHWGSFNNAGIINIAVNVSVEIQQYQPSTTWGFQLINNENYTVENIAFPSFSGIDQISTNADDDFLAYPKWGGILIKNPLGTLKIDQGLAYDNDYPSASNNMQFMGYYNQVANAGLYIACDDTAGNKKLFNVNRLGSNHLEFYINHTPVFTSHNTFQLPYHMQVSTFAGNWHDAAVKYRNQVSEAPWLSKGKISARTDIPDWFKKISYHSWIFTHPPEVPTANPFSMVPQVSNELHSFLKAPGITDWVGWENAGWYINYPDVFPPKEGWGSFSNTIRNVHDSGNHVMSISNTNSYSSAAPTFNSAQNFIIKTANNTNLPPSSYSEAASTVSLYTMCPATAFWKNIVAAMADTLVNRGMDAIQMDGFPLYIPVCYDVTHGHPVGGGNWWYNNYHSLYKSIRDRTRMNNSATAFSTEAMSEAFIPLFDSYWDPYTTGISPCQLQYQVCSNVELIPLWQVVYHEYILMQSGIAFYTPPAGEEDYYRRGLGLALTWGEVPTTFTTSFNLNNNPQSGLLAYLKQVVLARSNYAREFLIDGQMQKNIVFTVPQFLNAGANSIPYTGASYAAFNCPSVLTSSWKSQKGSAGHIFTNISGSAVSFTCQLPDYNYGGARFDIIKILNGNFSVLHRNSVLPQTESISLAASDVLIIKAIPAASTYYWTGTVSADWNNAANWSPAIVPTVNYDVVIPFGTPFSPGIANGINGFCKTIQVEPSAKVEVATGGNLKVGL